MKKDKGRSVLWLALGVVAGAGLLPMVTWLLTNTYLWQRHYDFFWQDFFESLYCVQLPVTGAILGVLSMALWVGRRGLFTRGACFFVSSATLILTGRWLWKLLMHDPTSIWFVTPPRGLIVLIATPVSLWALLLLFFSLVLRPRSSV